jgi:aldose 1-epimerase
MLIGMTILLTGTQYEIEAGDYRATVTELGAGLRGLRFGDTYLVTGFDADELPPHGAGQGERHPRPDPLGAVDPHRP